MRRIPQFPAFAIVLLSVAALIACGSPSSEDATPAGSPATAGPMNEKERLQAERWEQATAGLTFETTSGLVEVAPLVTGSGLAAGEHLAEAERLVGENRVMDAMEQYGLALRNDSDLAAAYAGLGATLERKGKQESAIAAFRTAVDRDADNLDFRYQLATSLWTASRQGEAIEEMNAVLAADEDHAGAHERLAVWSYYTGDHDAAWRHLHRAEALGKEVPAQLVALLEQQAPDPDASR